MRDWLRRPAAARDLGILALAVAVLWAVLGGHSAFGSSCRYAEAVREMVATGDWLLPRLYFVPYFEKPPLAYWAGAIPVALAGFSWHAVHLAPALAGLVSLAATWGLGRMLHGGGFALGAAGLLLGSAMFLVFTSELTTDPILSACLALCWLAYARHDRGDRGWIWLFWTALALGVMTKGLVAIGVAGAGIAAFHLLADGPLGVLRALWRMRPVSGSLLVLLINLPWNLLVWRADPRLVEYFWVRYNLGSFLGGIDGVQVNHSGPWYLYPAVIAVAFVPLTLPVMAALGSQIGAGWRARRSPDRLRLYLLACLIGPVLLLSASASKLPTYVLPLFPLVALLAADAWRSWAQRTVGQGWRRWLLPVQAAAAVVATIVAVAVIPQFATPEELPTPRHPLLLLAAGLLLAGQVCGAWWWWRGRYAAGAGAALAGLVLAALLLVPALERLVPTLTPSALAERVAAHRRPGDLTVVYHDQVHEYHLIRVLGRMPIVAGAREVGMGHFVEVVPPPTRIPADTYFMSGDQFPGGRRNPWLLTIGQVAGALAGDRRVWLFCDALFAHLMQARLGRPLHLAGQSGAVLLVSNLPAPWPMPQGDALPPMAFPEVRP